MKVKEFTGLNADDSSLKSNPTYQDDDGMISDEVIEAIKSITPQQAFEIMESLFSEKN
jgi:hypothetical protein